MPVPGEAQADQRAAISHFLATFLVDRVGSQIEQATEGKVKRSWVYRGILDMLQYLSGRIVGRDEDLLWQFFRLHPVQDVRIVAVTQLAHHLTRDGQFQIIDSRDYLGGYLGRLEHDWQWRTR